MTHHRLTLDYVLHAGRLQPWLDGLRAGRAFARQCRACHEVSFPPERCCACGCRAGDWIELSGRAEIIFRSDGPDGSFALVRFEGADRANTVRLSDLPPNADHGWLSACPDGLPAMVLGPRQTGIDDDSV